MIAILFILFIVSSQAQESYIFTKYYAKSNCSGLSSQGTGFINNKCIHLNSGTYVKYENWGEGVVQKYNCESTCNRCRDEVKTPYKCQNFGSTSTSLSYDRVPELQPTGFSIGVYLKDEKCSGTFDIINYFTQEICFSTGHTSQAPFLNIGNAKSIKMKWVNELRGVEVKTYNVSRNCEGENFTKDVWREGQCIAERSGPTVVFLKVQRK